ncbi:alpha/beta hydrolase domain-containing protein [Aquabacterium sp.]|uniref:alpha/beta hydrolase domain-containing protein n=1 Tax=Aquabacterium sp. TaxID=1872578 RepID=UPI003D6D2316
MHTHHPILEQLQAPLKRIKPAALAVALSGLTMAAQQVGATVSAPALQAVAAPYYGARADVEGLAQHGYVEAQFFVNGRAQKYKQSGSWASDGKWNASVASSGNPYSTLLIVRRPSDPAKFNGVVLVEWLNVSTGYPLDVDWGMAREEIVREGYAYIGINAQKEGITGIQKLKQFGDLYKPGSIPDDKLAFDIFSQAGKAVRDQAAVLLGPLQPKVVIATGHSQSAAAMVTYANAVQPLESVFDGFLIHGRGLTGLKLSSSDNIPLSASLRADTTVPIFMIQTEWDINLGGATSKQVDTSKLRHWEVAGTSHADQYLLDNIALVSQREVGWTPPACKRPYNSAPFYLVENAAIHQLKNWIVDGTAPSVAPRLQRDFFGSIKKDADGNALGGLRLPDLDAPIAKYGVSNSTTGSLAFLDIFACVAGGSTTPFTAAKLNSLYPTHDDYVRKYKAAADSAVAKGHILAVDRDAVVLKASQAAIPK